MVRRILASFTASIHLPPVRGPFLITQALRPYIPNHDNARIIMISSVAAKICGPGKAMYSGRISTLFLWTSGLTDPTTIKATKAAAESFVRTWNNEFGAEQGITVNAVNPGPVKYVYPLRFSKRYTLLTYPFPATQDRHVGCR
jgi:NAD(P)-dependent dehydrogenase (short-subunit alcohol dehydrogenase family)